MKRLFLSAQVHHVAKQIAAKIDNLSSLHGVFITTAFEDKDHNLDWHYRNKQGLVDAGFVFDLYTISGKSEQEIIKDLNSYDFIYVEGGNAFYLMQESQKNNFADYIRKRVNDGMIYIGTSAGSVAAGPDIDPVARPERTSMARDLASTEGFGLVDFSIIPHWADEGRRQMAFSVRLPHIYQDKWKLILLTNSQYVEVKDDYYRICDNRDIKA
ncbi:MAG: Type 1 glutamine amidotransferase-like domain-containing protein [bacterium]